MLRIKNKFDLNGKVAIITGSSKGIGASIARGLAEFGAHVIVTSRKMNAVEKVAQEIRDDGFGASAFECHVAHDEQRKNLINFATGITGSIDILINNVGTNPYYGPIEEMSFEAYQKTMDINVNAAMALSNLVYPFMKQQVHGSIIHISSIEGLHASAMMSAYNISKASLIMLGQNQAVEWAKDKIRVNIICPGLVQTKLSAALFTDEKMLERMINRIPLRRAADPDEIAGLACFLASDASSYTTGSVIVNDGGLLLASLF